MKSRTFSLVASSEEARMLAEALSSYAQAAYPPGGSECAQVARESLLESAREIASNAAGPAGATLSRRQRAIMKAGVRWYFSDEGPGQTGLHTALLRKFP